MRLTSTLEIAAPIDTVWAHLFDTSKYPDWNPFTPRVDGTPVQDGAVTLHVRLGVMPWKQRMKVVTVDPPRTLAWSLRGAPRWALHGVRSQTLTDLGDGTTRYETLEIVEGALAPLVSMLFGGATQSGLDAVAQALKSRCEALDSP